MYSETRDVLEIPSLEMGLEGCLQEGCPPFFFISGLKTHEKSMQPLYNVDNLITCDSTTTTNESHASLSVKSDFTKSLEVGS